MEPTQLTDAYHAGLNTLDQALQGLTTEHSRTRPADGSWTIHEILCHLADTEALFAERLRRVLTEDRPLLPVADPDACMRHLACDQRILEEEVTLIHAIRQQMTRILRAQPPEAWTRIGIHSQAGEQTLTQLVQKAINHLPHHLTFLKSKRLTLES